MLYNYFSKDSDLASTEKKGVFNSYEYIKRGIKSRPYLFLNIDTDRYSIPSFVHASFDLENFKKQVKRGDSVTYYTNENEELLQIKKGKMSYFDEDKRSSLDTRNNIMALILGIIFLVFTIMFVVKLFKS
jgi:hypothetical protein